MRGHIVFEGVLGGQSPNFDYTGLDVVEVPVMPPDADHVARFTISRSASTGQVGPVTQQMLNGMTTGQNILFAHGRLTYDDVAGLTHWVEWCYSLSSDFRTWAVYDRHNGIGTEEARQQ